MTATQALAAEYSAKAAAYARLWAPVLQPLALPLLDALPLASAGRVLDLGAGTGVLSEAIRSRAPEAHLVLADRVLGMLRLAPAGGWDSRVAMDAQELGFSAQVFDVVVLAFVLFHLPQRGACLERVRSVLRPGGTIGLTVWGDDPGVPGLRIWSEELDAAGAAREPRDPSTMQHAAMDTPEKLSALLVDCGFGEVRIGRARFEHAWSVERLLEVQLGCGMASRRIVSLPEEAASRCRARVEKRLRALSADELVYRPEVLWASARR